MQHATGPMLTEGPQTSVDVVQALHTYSPTEPGCLPFRRGDILLVFNRDASGWWDGVCSGQRGWFPSEYVGNAPESIAQKALAELAMMESESQPGPTTNGASSTGVSSIVGYPVTSPAAAITDLASGENRGGFAALPANWKAVFTADGRVFYHNTVTDATTWNIDDVRPADDRPFSSHSPRSHQLSIDTNGAASQSMRPRLPTLTGRPHPTEKSLPPNTAPIYAAMSVLPVATSASPVDQHIDTTSEPTFDALVNCIIQPISELAVAGASSKSRFARLTNDVSLSCRLVFAYCGILQENSPALHDNPSLAEKRREIVGALNQLALAARVALGVWPPSDAVHHLRHQAMAVLHSIKQFVKLTENFPLLLDPEALERERIRLLPTNNAAPHSPDAANESNLPFLGETSAKAREEAFIAQLDEYRRVINRVGGELMRRVSLELHAVSQSPNSSEPVSERLTADALLVGVKDTVNKTGQLLSFLEDLRAPDDLLTPDADDATSEDECTIPARTIRQSLEDPLEEFGSRRDALYNLLNDLLNSARMAVGGALPPVNFIENIFMTVRDILLCTDSVVDCAKVVVRRRELVEVLLANNVGFKAGISTNATTDLLALRRKTRSLQHMAARNQTPSNEQLNSGPSHPAPGPRRTTMQSSAQTPAAIRAQALAASSNPIPSAIPLHQPSATMPYRRLAHAAGEVPGSIDMAMNRSASAGVFQHQAGYGLASSISSSPRPGQEYSNAVAPLSLPQSPVSSAQPAAPKGASVIKFFDGQTPGAQDVDNTTPWYLRYDYQPDDVTFNLENGVTGGTFEALVERLTLHDTAIDAEFSMVFMLTFRCYATPEHFFKCLVERYDRPSPDGLAPEQLANWRQRKQMPTRLRVFNILKTWLMEYFFDSVDDAAIPFMIDFAQNGTIREAMPSNSARLGDLIQNRSSRGSQPAVTVVAARSNTARMSRSKSIDRLILAATSSEKSGEAPTPVITRQQLNNLRQRQVNVVDLDPLELARQLTLLDSTHFCAIHAFELVGQEFMNKESTVAVNVRAMSSLTNNITTWVAETILKEPEARKRSAIIKFFIKVAEKCFVLGNFNSLVAVLCALNSSTIDRLRKTWAYLSSKSKSMITLNELRKAVDHSRNYAEYRARIRAMDPPCIPFFGLYLTDVVFMDDGNPNFRRPPGFVPGQPETKQLVNFDKYVKTVRIIQDMRKFQQRYNLTKVPEMITWLKESFESSVSGGDSDALYSLSLQVEPREESSFVPQMPPQPSPPIEETQSGDPDSPTDELQSPVFSNGQGYADAE